jgi:hypothetical protein
MRVKQPRLVLVHDATEQPVRTRRKNWWRVVGRLLLVPVYVVAVPLLLVTAPFVELWKWANRDEDD